MEFNLRTNQSIAELTVISGNATITEDLSGYDSKKRDFFIDNGLIESVITLANDMSRFNNISDVDFVKNIFDTFLNDSEKAKFLEIANNL